MSTPASPALHWPCLLAGLTLMLAGSTYPFMFARSDGHPDHALALLLFWAMSAGFVRGVGFVPRRRLWQRLFSGWACLTTLGLAAASLIIKAG